MLLYSLCWWVGRLRSVYAVASAFVLVRIKRIRRKENNTKNNNTTKHTFFKRTESLTEVVFTENELQLLDKGLKYNLHYKPKTWIKTLAMEADTVIRELPEKDQGYMKQLANKITRIIMKEDRNNESRNRKLKHTKREYHEWRTIKSIKQKLTCNQLIVTKAKEIH
jgi:hypothetical protein